MGCLRRYYQRVIATLLFGSVLLSPMAVAAGQKTWKPVPLAHGERFITASDGAKIFVKVEGHGQPCMLIHGGPGQGFLSTEQLGFNRVEQFTTMIYVDQRGSGHSPDASNYHLNRVVQDFEDVRSALGIKKMCLIAHSFGGLLAVNYAARFPSHVSGIVLANSTLHFRGPEQARMQIDFVNRILGREVVRIPENTDAATMMKLQEKARSALVKSGQGYRFLADNKDGIIEMSKVDASYKRSNGFGRAVIEDVAKYPEYEYDYVPMSRDIRMPVLIIAGAKDYAIGPHAHEAFMFPNSSTVILNAGHMSYFEDSEGFSAAIEAFVKKLPRTD